MAGSVARKYSVRTSTTIAPEMPLAMEAPTWSAPPPIVARLPKSDRKRCTSDTRSWNWSPNWSLRVA
ncbi:Uncharacterised protein [Mycobacterium tuberculosis]|nr:Uncharacterised protein [Mycobacterium tuberculosis]